MTGLPQVGGSANDAAPVAASEVSAEAGKPPVEDNGSSTGGGRSAQILAAILKSAHSREEGEKLLIEIRGLSDDKAMASKLGLSGGCAAAEIADAFKRCPPYWANNFDRDVAWIVTFILEECVSMV